MFGGALLKATRQVLREDGILVGLIGGTDQIEVSRDGRPDPAKPKWYLGLHIAEQSNGRTVQQAGIAMDFRLEAVLTKSLESHPKDFDHEFYFGDNSAIPIREHRIIRLLHNSLQFKTEIAETLASFPSAEDSTGAALEFGLVYLNSSFPEFVDDEWFFAETEREEFRNPQFPTSKNRIPIPERKPEEAEGLVIRLSFAARITVTHRALRIAVPS